GGVLEIRTDLIDRFVFRRCAVTGLDEGLLGGITPRIGIPLAHAAGEQQQRSEGHEQARRQAATTGGGHQANTPWIDRFTVAARRNRTPAWSKRPPDTAAGGAGQDDRHPRHHSDSTLPPDRRSEFSPPTAVCGPILEYWIDGLT